MEVNIVLLNSNDQKDKKFDVVQSEFDAYKRWGYAVNENSVDKKTVISEMKNQPDEKKKTEK